MSPRPGVHNKQSTSRNLLPCSDIPVMVQESQLPLQNFISLHQSLSHAKFASAEIKE
jgi:hypothetical protein